MSDISERERSRSPLEALAKGLQERINSSSVGSLAGNILHGKSAQNTAAIDNASKFRYDIVLECIGICEEYTRYRVEILDL